MSVVGVTGTGAIANGVRGERSSRRAFFTAAALLFAVSAAATIHHCLSMPAMGEMPMAGGWTMSTAWRPMCGRTWFGAAASFASAWLVMMVAMMMPSLAPMLWRYRQELARLGAGRVGCLTMLAGVGYFALWSIIGMAAFPLGAGVATLAMKLPGLARAVPIATAVVVVIAGALQFTAWKARHLALCRSTPGQGVAVPVSAGAALRYGVRLGLRCCASCAGPTAILLATGVMELHIMALVTTAITLERLAPNGVRLARAIGAVAIAAGAVMLARAGWLG